MHMQHKVDPDDALRLPSFRSLYGLTAVLGLLLAGHLLLAALGKTGPARPFGFLDLALLAALLGGARIVYGALVGLLEGNIGADLALAIAVLASLMLKEYWVGAEVVFIAMLGESLEAVTFSRTHREIRRILELRPRTARVLRGDAEHVVPVEEVAVGDRVLVRPGERIPVDGTVLKGESAVDQSTLTGESLPADKTSGSSVFTGTLNQFGALEVQADKVGEDTTLAQVIHLVAQAQQHKAPIERTADRMARLFLPAVLVAALATLLYTNWGTTSWSRLNWMPTLAVLVVACPCALILATPAAIMAALAWLAKRGVLIKGGEALERLAAATVMVFDKTGTLTEARLELGEVLPMGGESPEHVLAVAAAAEQHSEHPVARLILDEARRRGLTLPAIADFRAFPGAGVVARLAEQGEVASVPAARGPQISVGNARLLEQQGIGLSRDVSDAFERLDAAGQTSLAIAFDGRVIGVIGARDTVRPEAHAVVDALRHLGIEEIVLLTGDRRPAARAVAAAVGVSEFHAELFPEEKAAWITRRRQQAGEAARSGGRPVRIAMVGDGVNDAPALASADVGLALGGVGSDIAAEAGDIILMGDPLAPLPDLVRLSRAVVRVIWQNIVVFAFFVNAVAILLAALQKLGPVGAAIYHQIGSFLVLVNAMRLLWFEQWERSPLGQIEASAASLAGRAGRLVRPLVEPLAWLGRHARPAAFALVALAALGYLASGINAVGPDELGVVKRFGRITAILEPGLAVRFPPPIETIIRFAPDRVRVAEIGFRSKPNAAARESGQPVEWTSTHGEGLIERVEDEALVFTGDENLLEMNAAVQFSVRRSELTHYLFAVRNPDDLLKALAEGVLREIAAHRAFWEILTAARGEIEQQAHDLLQARADQYQLGVEVRSVSLEDVHPPLQVVSAFHDVSSAFKDRERLQKEAVAYRQQQIIGAAGRAAAEILDRREPGSSGISAEVWSKLREAATLSGEAESEILKAEALRSDRVSRAAGEADAFRRRQAAYALAPELSELRLYLEMIEATLPDKEKLVLDPAAAGRRQLFLANPDRFKQQPLPPVLAAPTRSPQGDDE